MAENPFRALPSVLELSANVDDSRVRPELKTRFLREFLDREREAIRLHGPRTRDEIIEQARLELGKLHVSKLSPLINATGVVLHTNLGRAQVSAATADAMSQASRSAVALEIDPESNNRGGRMTEISALMRLLTGAESTLVVNNNAAAVLLVLSALASGRSVVVSRGEAIEIGGGFRIPEVLVQSGATLVEVGTTNRTYPSDYEDAIGDETAVLLKVHTSNFRLSGFTATTSIQELIPIARRRGCVVIEDLGSGALIDTAQYGLEREPLIGESIAAGADIVLASGDKLLGGPQAGIIAGRADLVKIIAEHPLARAVRADKTCLAGVAVTLRHYVFGDAESEIPVWRMIASSLDGLSERAEDVRRRLEQGGIAVDLLETKSTVGGGSLPGQEQPSIAVVITSRNGSITETARQLRIGNPGIFGRIDEDRLLLDLRTVLPEQDDDFVHAVSDVLSGERHL